MADPDEAVFAGEVSDDWNVALQADLVGDPRSGVVRVRASAGAGPTLSDVRLTDGVLRNVNLERTRFTESVLEDVDIWVWGRDLSLPIEGLRINGIEVAPLVEAELDRRHPERQHLRGLETLDQLRTAWPHVEAMWAPTIEWARTLPEATLREQVNGEFSFLQTLRHLLFGFDSWVRRAVRHEERPYHTITLAYPDNSATWSAAGPVPWSEVGIDIHADPSLEEVLATREDNFATMRATLDELDEDGFHSTPEPLQTPGYPAANEFRSIDRCLRTIVNEEWWHRQYAIRDLAVLTDEA